MVLLGVDFKGRMHAIFTKFGHEWVGIRLISKSQDISASNQCFGERTLVRSIQRCVERWVVHNNQQCIVGLWKAVTKFLLDIASQIKFATENVIVLVIMLPQARKNASDSQFGG